MSPLYVFVGEKIEVTEYQPEVPEGARMMDFAFKAKYKILEPFYRIKNRKATAVYGNYIEELFELKKCGALKVRKHFK